MKLTITMPNWNRAWHLDRSLYLISKQTIPQEDWELIVVDDGSTDNTDEVIQKYKDMNIIKNFHYIKKINKRHQYGNCAIARNIGAMAGSGDYILFTDPEVMPLPNWAEQHYIGHTLGVIRKPDIDACVPVDSDIVDMLDGWDVPEGGRRQYVINEHLEKLGKDKDISIIGFCLQPREHHIVNDNCEGKFLGDAYTDYDWHDIERTWNEMERRIKTVQNDFQLSDQEIRAEFYIYQATQAGYSLSRRLFIEVRGFEENFSNASIGLDKWAGEDTLFHKYLLKKGIGRAELQTAKAIHIYHDKVCSNYEAVEYAHKYSDDHLDECQSNIGREFGLIEENGFVRLF